MDSKLFSKSTPKNANDIYRSVIGVLLKHLGLFLFVLFSGLFIGIGFTLVRPPKYVSQAQLMLGITTSPYTTTVSSLLPDEGTVLPQNYFHTIVQSEYYERQLVDSLEAAGYEPKKSESLEEEVQDGIKYTIDKFGTIITIESSKKDPQDAYTLVRNAALVFQQRSTSLQQQELTSALNFISNQIEVLSAEIKKNERKIKEFEKDKGIIPGESGSGDVWDYLYELQRQLADVEVSISLEEMDYRTYNEQFDSLASSETTEIGGFDDPRLNAVRSDLDSLQNRLGELLTSGSEQTDLDIIREQIDRKQNELVTAITSNIDVSNTRRQRTATLNAIIDQMTDVEVRLAGSRNRKAYLEAEIRKYKRQNPDLLDSSLQYSLFLREQESLRANYNSMLEQREETEIRIASETGGTKIIDPPFLPVEPEDPETVVYIIVTIIVVFAIASMVVYIRNLFDNSIKNAEEVQNSLDLLVLGTIPRIRKKDIRKFKGRDGEVAPKMNGKIYPFVTLLPMIDPAVEAYRSLRTAIVFHPRGKTLKNIVISGIDHGSGKTLTALNLAIVFAMGGKKTLLIDADLRLPDLHKLFDVQRTPGLSDFMEARAETDKVIKNTSHENLWVVPAGSEVLSPSDLISSSKMDEFLRIVKREFDLVIVDTPPISVGIDAKILAAKTDGAIIIARSDKCTINDIRESAQEIDDIRGRVLGVVLNIVNMNSLYGKYSYGRKLRSYYKYYHAQRLLGSGEEA